LPERVSYTRRIDGNGPPALLPSSAAAQSAAA
jgi:hypothetical protein